MERHLADEQQTIELGKQLAGELADGAVVALTGGLGAGKTCLVRGLVLGLGSPARVTSPTFTLVHEYGGGRLDVAHFDFYRVAEAAELVDAGWDDYLDRGGVVVAEWADRFPALLPRSARWWCLEWLPHGRLARELPAAPEGPQPLSSTGRRSSG